MAKKINPEKKTRYLQSALKLFVENGVKNTSTAAISREAGTASGTLFLYFSTKQDLVHELVLDIARQQSEFINALQDPSSSAMESFHTIWTGSIQWFLEHMDAYQYIRQVRDSGLIAEDVVQESENYLSYYYAAIQKGFEERTVKPYPFELVGAYLYQGIVSVMNLLANNSDPDLHESYINDGFEIFWNGIKAD